MVNKAKKESQILDDFDMLGDLGYAQPITTYQLGGVSFA